MSPGTQTIVMEVEVRLFASLKDRAGAGRVAVAVPAPATVARLTDALAARYPALQAALPSALVAVNHDFAFADTPIAPGDEVAIFPPVSGGAGELPYPTYFSVSADELDVAAINAHLLEPEVGAVVFFQGAVRGETARQGLPDQTLYLEYEAYEEMARRKMEQIAREIWAKWPLVRGIAMVQRIGTLQIGETTTFVACAAGHRDQGAFEAARYGIDRLKEIVPIWKKEVGADRSLWIEGDYRPTVADRQD